MAESPSSRLGGQGIKKVPKHLSAGMSTAERADDYPDKNDDAGSLERVRRDDLHRTVASSLQRTRSPRFNVRLGVLQKMLAPEPFSQRPSPAVICT